MLLKPPECERPSGGGQAPARGDHEVRWASSSDARSARAVALPALTLLYGFACAAAFVHWGGGRPARPEQKENPEEN
jgi:hypothetical protein